MVLSRERLLTFIFAWEGAETSYKKSRDQDAKFHIVEDYKIETGLAQVGSSALHWLS